MKKYKVKFIGTNNIEEVEATNEREAKEVFLRNHHLGWTSIGYVVIVRK